MYTVAQVLNPGFPRSWSEAVAIVQEVISQVQPGLAVPAPGDLGLEVDGALVFGFGNESNDNPVSAAARLLQALLEGIDAPASLRDLAAENAGSKPSHATIDGFSKALAFFERPNRAGDLRAVAGRLRTFRESHETRGPNPDQEFERLREKVAAKPEQRQEKKEPKKPRLSKRQRMGLVAALAIVLLGTLAMRYGGGAGVRLQGLLTRAEKGVAMGISAGLDRLGIAGRAEAAPDASKAPPPSSAKSTSGKGKAAPPRSIPAAASRPEAAAVRGVRPAVLPPAVTQAAGADTRSGPESQKRTAALWSDVPSVAALPAPQPLAAGLGGPPVYTSDDHEVVGPRLVRPQLPGAPPPGQDTGYFEMVINESGDVEQVRLSSPRRRFHDRMLVAAAKAWKFTPATLNGEPVRYRIRVPIILPVMP